MIRDWVHEVAGNDVVFGKCSIPGWRCCKDGVRAKIVFAVPAIAAMATRDARLDGNSLSDFDICYFVADLDDGAYKLSVDSR